MNHTIKRADGRALALARSTRNQAKGTTRVYEQVQLYEGTNTVFVHLICHRANNGQRVFLATTRTDFDDVVALYKRWAAETAFGFLKSKGVDWKPPACAHPSGSYAWSACSPSAYYGPSASESTYTNKSRSPTKSMAIPHTASSEEDSMPYNTASPSKNKTPQHDYTTLIRLLVSCS